MSVTLLEQTDAQRVAAMIAAMAELFGVTARPVRIRGYVEALADVPLERVRDGIRRASQGWCYPDMPKPGDILAAIEGARHPQTHWPAGWRDHCPHGTCVIPTQCPEAWAWVKPHVA